MLKHTTPRSSPSLSNDSFQARPTVLTKYPTTTLISDQTDGSPENRLKCSESPNGSYSERSIDCKGILKSVPLQKKYSPLGIGIRIGEKLLGISGPSIGPVITHGRAIVKRGLSLNLKGDETAVKTVRKTDPLPKSTHVIKASENGDIFHQKSSNGDAVLEKNPVSFSKSLQNVKPPAKHDTPTLQSLLRLPGVYGHIPVPVGSSPASPHIISLDSMSINSGNSFLSSNSRHNSSRSWTSNSSSVSQNTKDSCKSDSSSPVEPFSSTTMKVYAKCLRSDIEYKTLNVGPRVTCKELIQMLLSKARMRHRDPNIFYLTMEVTARRWSGIPVRALLVLEDHAKPAQLALCRPPGDLQFTMQMKRGGVIKVQDTILMSESQYKSLLVSYRTNTEEVIQLLLNCSGKRESKHFYALHEVRISPTFKDRRIHSDEKPLEVKSNWPSDRSAEFVFVLRRNMSQAFSLRKLSLQTAESQIATKKTVPNRKLAPESVPEVSTPSTSPITTVQAATHKIGQYEESQIDCTTTVPIVQTVVRNALEIPISVPEMVNEDEITTVEMLLAKLNPVPTSTIHKPRIALPDPYIKPVVPIRTRRNFNNHQLIPTKLLNIYEEPKREALYSEPISDKAVITKSLNSNYLTTLRTDVRKVSCDAQTQTSLPNGHLSAKDVPNDVPPSSTDSHENSKQLSNLKLFGTLQKYNDIVSTPCFNGEIKYLSIKGSMESTHRWNSVEALLDTFNSNCIESNVPVDSRASSRHKEHLEQCEQNCKNCFYI